MENRIFKHIINHFRSDTFVGNLCLIESTFYYVLNSQAAVHFRWCCWSYCTIATFLLFLSSCCEHMIRLKASLRFDDSAIWFSICVCFYVVWIDMIVGFIVVSYALLYNVHHFDKSTTFRHDALTSATCHRHESIFFSKLVVVVDIVWPFCYFFCVQIFFVFSWNFTGYFIFSIAVCSLTLQQLHLSTPYLIYRINKMVPNTDNSITITKSGKNASKEEREEKSFVIFVLLRRGYR